MKFLEHKSIVLVTHSRIYSASQALRDFLREHNTQNLLYISHPLPLKDVRNTERSMAQISHGTRIVRRFVLPIRVYNVIVSSIIEFITTLWWVMRTGKRYDLFIGVDNLNALEGLILRALGRVDKVVYYTIDYFPTRFKQPWLNNLYHSIDKFCVRHCDETWNVSSVMVEARKKLHHTRHAFGRQYTVPIGIWFGKIKRKPYQRTNKTKIVFSGHLVPHMGVDMLIRAMPGVIREVPNASLDIVGGGEELEKLKHLAETLPFDGHIRFYGWVTDRKKLEDILTNAAIGVAPFNTEILDEKVKNADPGKLKDYMACGLAVVVTDAIATATQLEKQKCAIVVPYGKRALVRAIVRLLKDEKLMQEYRENAIAYSQQFDYEELFPIHLARVLAL